jgi:hypothetical protein
MTSMERRYLSDSVATLFDSLIAVHQTKPDTALLLRLYPSRDTMLYIVGDTAQRMSGDSLCRRTIAAHGMVHEMAPRATERVVQVLDRDHAVANAIWTVDVVDSSMQHHPWRGPITIAVVRKLDRWVIRVHRE